MTKEFKIGDFVKILKHRCFKCSVYKEHKDCIGFVGKITSFNEVKYYIVKFYERYYKGFTGHCAYNVNEIRKATEKEHDRFFLLRYRD